MFIPESSFNIINSIFINCYNGAADRHGVTDKSESSFSTASSTFTNNSAAEWRWGGVMVVSESSFNITNSVFTNNSAADRGGVIYTSVSSFNVINSTFTDNSASEYGGVMFIAESSFNVIGTTFTKNSAAFSGGVMYTSDSSFSIINSIFIDNSAAEYGGVMFINESSFYVINSTFTNSSTAECGGVMVMSESSSNIINSTFTKNSAAYCVGVMYVVNESSFSIIGSTFRINAANGYGGIMTNIGGVSHISNTTFDYNLGSLFTFRSNLTFSGYTRFENCMEPSSKTGALRQGGAITSYQSTILFTGVSSLLNNQANGGGAILATESTIVMYGETIIDNNTATNSNGGGIFLHQSNLEIRGNSTIAHNHAESSGGIHASSSPIYVYQQGTLQLINNTAKADGGGMHLEVNPKLYLLKSEHKVTPCNDVNTLLLFTGNNANRGGAVYVADDTNSAACSATVECFIQTLALYQIVIIDNRLCTENIIFSGNAATEQGSNLFGGLLDRCIPSSFAEVKLKDRTRYNGVTYLKYISDIRLDSIASLPVQVCFCNSEGQPDCSSQPPHIKVKKGETFTISLVAVDQVNHSVDATITSLLTSPDGGLNEGQQTQSINRSCTDLTFNVFSPDDSETITLFADGPCRSCLLYTSPSPRDATLSRMPSSA